MTIKEVQEQKLKIEMDILQILADFQSETGLSIVHINLDMSTMFGKGTRVDSVNVEVTL